MIMIIVANILKLWPGVSRLFPCSSAREFAFLSLRHSQAEENIHDESTLSEFALNLVDLLPHLAGRKLGYSMGKP